MLQFFQKEIPRRMPWDMSNGCAGFNGWWATGINLAPTASP